MEINYPPYTITDKMLNYVSDIMSYIISNWEIRDERDKKRNKNGKFN